MKEFNPVKWFEEWLNTNIGDKTIAARLAELIVINGSTLDIKTAGKTVPAKNPVGRLGLTLDEAMELTYYKGALDIFQTIVPKNVLGMSITRCIDRLNGNNIQIPTAEEKVILLKKY